MSEVLMHVPRLNVELDDGCDGMLEVDFSYELNGLNHRLTFFLEASTAKAWGLDLLTKSKAASRKVAASG